MPARTGEASVPTGNRNAQGLRRAGRGCLRLHRREAPAVHRRMRVYLAPKVLIVDEFGIWPYDRDAATAFFSLVSAKYERGSIILTSNKGFAEWGELLGDTVIATAILDRLFHHSHVLNIRGESYRLRDKRQAGLLTSQRAGRRQLGVPRRGAHMSLGRARANDQRLDRRPQVRNESCPRSSCPRTRGRSEWPPTPCPKPSHAVPQTDVLYLSDRRTALDVPRWLWTCGASCSLSPRKWG